MKKLFGIGGGGKEDSDARPPPQQASAQPSPPPPALGAAEPTKGDAEYWRARLAGHAKYRSPWLAGLGWDFSACGESLGDMEAIALAEALKEHASITALKLRNNSIGDDGVRALAEALKGNSALDTLDLSNNHIGNEGARALAEALKANLALTNLDLHRNSIGDDGARALAEMLKWNTVLRELQLWNNSIGDEGARALLSAVELNPFLTNLDLKFPGETHPLAFATDNQVSFILLEQIKDTLKDPGRKERALQKQRELEAERRGDAERAREAELLLEVERLREAERLRESERQRAAEAVRRRIIEAEQQATRQRQREAGEAEALRKQQQLENEARDRQAREREAELAQRLEEVKLREQEAERKIAEAQEMAKQARGDSVYDPAIAPRSRTEPSPPADKQRSSKSSYEIEGKHLEQGRYLGQGGFGTVIEGTYQKYTKVAIKMIRGSNLKGRQLENAIAGLEQEMELWSRLPYHENVLPLMGWCREPLCLVTLFMAGGTATDYLDKLRPKAYEPRVVHHLLFQVALGMNHLHSRPTPILHLDLKGGNILVDANGVAKVSDFGMSKIRTTAALQSTDRGGGTPNYMAPEMFSARAKPGTATDVYAFAMTMWELLSEGDIPLWDEIQDEGMWIPALRQIDLQALGARLQNDPPFRPPRPRGTPDATWALMQRCWAMDAATRPSFGDVADELKGILDNL
ncbi:kinase-like domain-containing protein [Hyaloraphidium curvatum]|nr:kinase-like domain-containing protein [Hyaloraphidium curvatum]